MLRYAIIFLATALSALAAGGQTHNAVVVDSATKTPLPNASVFDRHGNVAGTCSSKGRMPYIAAANYPVTVRYLGFKEETVENDGRDTIFLEENVTELPEVVVESRLHKVIHMLAYVREYSTLSTYTDTVFLFREKMVDYMLQPDKKISFKGWSSPRILKSKSYYRFTNAQGLDSVSDECNHHFSWSDWVGVAPVPEMIGGLRDVEAGTDTVMGKYSPTEVWIRNHDKVTVNVNVLADKTSRRWVPNLSDFFSNGLDFENFRIRFNYSNVAGDSIAPTDLTGYSFAIESNGRGHKMFRFNRIDQPFFVSTYAEVYILDKEYITIKEARKWERLQVDTDDIEIYEPAEAPDLQPSILELVARVNNVDTEQVRLAITPDHRMIGRKVRKQHLGQRALQIFKTITGISSFRAKRNLNRQWNDFRKGRIHNNDIQRIDTDKRQKK